MIPGRGPQTVIKTSASVCLALLSSEMQLLRGGQRRGTWGCIGKWGAMGNPEFQATDSWAEKAEVSLGVGGNWQLAWASLGKSRQV